MAEQAAAPRGRPAAVYWSVALGILCFSASAILVRLADEAPGMTIAVWRTSFAVLLLAPFAVPRIGPEVRRFSKKDVLLITGAGVFLGFHFIAWIESLYYTSVASATVLVTTSPIFLAILGFALLGERLSRRATLGIALAVCGAALMGWGDASAADADVARHALWGNALALGAALLVSLYLLIGRVVRQGTSWLAYVFPLYAVVALTTLVVAFVRQVPLFGFPPVVYGLCALMALGPQLVGHGSFNYALRYVPAALLALLALLEPVLASAMAYGLFGETPGGFALLGMAVILGAVTLAIWPGWRGKGRKGEREKGRGEERKRRGTDGGGNGEVRAGVTSGVRGG